MTVKYLRHRLQTNSHQHVRIGGAFKKRPRRRGQRLPPQLQPRRYAGLGRTCTWGYRPRFATGRIWRGEAGPTDFRLLPKRHLFPVIHNIDAPPFDLRRPSPVSPFWHRILAYTLLHQSIASLRPSCGRQLSRQSENNITIMHGIAGIMAGYDLT
ncbi:hypothetical protein FIBSPDRAFT_988301 [Athelia psychrophila]|uniref:Uncharacterized protein n=1 Tax=Athelia psychrophila TaxID=1759441 RepID=A0A166A713_9AGAM|nr:hypothetical protein FIBSPDRAFT_988301 [Fibularhizoctonia sp. CBS 109695]